MLFGPDKELEKLPAEDQDWFKANKGLSARAKLLACAQQNAVARIGYLQKKHNFDRSDRLPTALAAVNGNAPEALTMILGGHGFDFGSESSQDFAGAKKLFEEAAKTGSLPLWKALCSLNKNTSYGQLSLKTISSLLPRDADFDFLRFHLTEAKTADDYAILLKEHGMTSTARLKFVLGWARKLEGVQGVLDTALTTVSNDAEKTELLLSCKADPNASGALAFRNALEAENRAVIDLLLPHVDLSRHGENILAELKVPGCKLDLAWLEEKVEAACAEKRLQSMQEKYTLIDRHTLSETKRISNKLTLTTVFNFSSCQQTTIARDGEHMAVTVTDFTDIGNRAYIDTMRAKLAELGGEADSTALQKNKLTQKP